MSQALNYIMPFKNVNGTHDWKDGFSVGAFRQVKFVQNNKKIDALARVLFELLRHELNLAEHANIDRNVLRCPIVGTNTWGGHFFYSFSNAIRASYVNCRQRHLSPT